MKNIILLSIISLAGFFSSAQCSANFTMTVSGNTVQFTNTSSGTNTYDWWFGDGGSTSTVNPSYTYSSPGTYSVCLTAYYQDSTGGFCIDTLCQPVTVQGGGGTSCNADFTWTVSGTTVFFNNTSTGTNMNDWSFDDGNYSWATNPSHTYATSGTYWVCLYSYYDDSLSTMCGDSVCYQISVFDSLDSTASAVALSLNEFQLYPNPTNSVLNIRFDQLPDNAYVSIVDVFGREMTRIDLRTQVTAVPVVDFPGGVYLVQLLDRNGQVIGLSRFVRE